MSSTKSSSVMTKSSFSSTSSTKKTVSSTFSSKTTSSSSISGRRPQFSSLCFSDMMGDRLGLDMDKEMDKLRLEMGMSDSTGDFATARRDLLHLMPLTKFDSADELVKLDAKSIDQYFDTADKNLLKFNMDVDEFESESINVKVVGNKIEVHAQKKSKKGDQHKSEEYSRTYELPTSKPLDPEKLTSSFYKDGVLTIELPIDGDMLTL